MPKKTMSVEFNNNVIGTASEVSLVFPEDNSTSLVDGIRMFLRFLC